MLETKIFRVLKDIFIRKHIREINFYFATLSFNECLSILFRVFKSYFGKEDIVRGSFINKFERNFAKYIGVDSAFSFGAGRMAFYVILKAIGIGKGDEIILPAYTCSVVSNAIIYCGAKPIYVDINSKTFNIDVVKIEEKINSQTKAIMVQHTFGLPVDMDKLTEIAKRHNIRVIEDCAQALGAEYKGKKVGVFGDAAFFSFELSKVITTGWGGMAVTNDSSIKEKLEEEQRKTLFLDLRKTRKIAWQIIFSYFLYHPWNYWWGKFLLMILYKIGIFLPSIKEEERQGKKPSNYPHPLSNIQSRLGLSQLDKINKINEKRIKIAQLYNQLLKKLGIFINETDAKIYKHIYLRYAFTVNNSEKAKKFFAKNQIELGEWFNQVIVCTDIPLEKLNYKKGSCPNAEWVARHIVNLPTQPRVSNKDIERIIKITQTFLINRKAGE